MLSLREVCTASKWDSSWQVSCWCFCSSPWIWKSSFPCLITEKNTYIPSKGRANGAGNSWIHCRRKAANPFAFTVARSRSLLACGESKKKLFIQKGKWRGVRMSLPPMAMPWASLFHHSERPEKHLYSKMHLKKAVQYQVVKWTLEHTASVVPS